MFAACISGVGFPAWSGGNAAPVLIGLDADMSSGAATWPAMNGVNESVLQGLLGHAAGSRVTKAYYVHATEDAKRAAVIELPMTVRNQNTGN